MRVTILLIISFIFLFSQNLEELKRLGEKGDINALTTLGMMYENGDGVEVNLDLAKRYYSQAAELGSEDAKIALALLLLDETIQKSVSLKNKVAVKGNEKLNIELSIEDLKEILNRAKKMDKDALFTLATIYENGIGDIKPDIKRALALYKKAAKLGSQKAKRVLELKGEKVE
ncbi:MAG: sel1 repeat family protein [Epsilonproteobacteria bacterium]|nr:sel1 repeat family protein [Campylobacterota bacterium]